MVTITLIILLLRLNMDIIYASNRANSTDSRTAVLFLLFSNVNGINNTDTDTENQGR